MRMNCVVGVCAVALVSCEALAARRYVNINLTTGANNGTSWANAYRGPDCLDTASTAAVAGDEVWVARGTYKPNIRTVPADPRSARFEFKGRVNYFGGFVGNEATTTARNLLAMRTSPTVLSGDLAGDDGDMIGAITLATYSDNAWQIVHVADQSGAGLIDGFTFVGAHSENTPVAGDAVTGALGIDEQVAGNQNGSIATITNCQFLRNRSTTDGGAAIRFVAGQGGADQGRLVLSNCFFAGNDATTHAGGAVKVTGNAGGHTFLQCVFSGNFAAGGAAVSTPEATFTNCTFSANASTGASGAVTDSSVSNSLTVQNCIFSANTRNGGVNDLLAQVDNATSTYSCFHGFIVAGMGNIDSDPHFTDFDGADDEVGTLDDDLRLAYGFGAGFFSCVDGGNNSVNVIPINVGGTQGLPSTDIAGKPRIVDGNLLGPVTVDMGAYESTAGVPTNVNQRVWKQPSPPGIATDAASWHGGVPLANQQALVRREYLTGLEAASLVMNIPTASSWRTLSLINAGDVSVSVAPGQLLTLTSTSAGISVDAASRLNWSGSAVLPGISCESGVLGFGHGAPAEAYGLVVAGAQSVVNVTPSNSFAGFIENTGAMLVDGARVSCSNYESGGFLHVNGPVPPGFASNFLVQQSLTVENGLLITNGGVLSSRTARVTANSGRVVIDGIGSRWSVPFFLSVDGGGIDLQNGGSISTGFGAFFFPEGAFRGSGELHSYVVNFGNIEPGVFDEEGADVGVGTLAIIGDYEQLSTLEKFGTDSGQLLLDVGVNKEEVYEYDRLTASGRASLGGGLLVNFRNVPPPVGATAEILAAGQIASTFDVAYFPAFSSDPKDPRFFRLEYNNPAKSAVATITLVVDSLASLVDLSSAQNFAAGGRPNAAALGDLDGDGDLDLAVVVPDADPQQDGRLVVLFNQTNAGASFGGFQIGSIEYPTGPDPSAVAIGDLNVLPGPEIAITNRGADSVRLFNNNGGGIFTQAPSDLTVGAAPADVVIVDLDQDGANDLVVANSGSNTLASTRNLGGGAFGAPEFIVVDDMPVDIDPTDLDNDKDIDIVVVNGGSNSVSLVIGDGKGGLVEAASLPVGDDPVAVTVAFLDDDLFPDIVTTDQAGNTLSVLRSQNALQYAPSVQLPVGLQPRSIVAVDLDNDGDLDLAVVADDPVDGPVVQVIRNDSPAGQLAFAAAANLAAGATPILVLAGNVDNQGGDDLVTINDATVLAAGAPGSEAGSMPPNDVSVLLDLPPEPCAGDTNGDNLVNGADLSVLLGQFGQSVTPGTGADFNADGMVNGADLSVLLGRFGTAC